MIAPIFGTSPQRIRNRAPMVTTPRLITPVIAIKMQPAGILAQIGYGLANGVLNPEIDIVLKVFGPGDRNNVFRLEVYATLAALRVDEHHRDQK